MTRYEHKDAVATHKRVPEVLCGFCEGYRALKEERRVYATAHFL